MKRNQIIILGIILGALVAATLLKTVVQKMDPRTAKGTQLYGALAFDFTPGKVERILLARGMETPSVELVKTNGFWKVKSLWNAAANEGKVNNFLAKLRSAQGELRATEKNLFADFGIGDQEAFSIQLKGAENRSFLDLRIGAKPVDREGYFLRKAAGDEVYFTDMNMAELLGIFTEFTKAVPLSGYWADLALFHIDIDHCLSVVTEHLSKEKGRTPVLGIRRDGTGDDPSKNPWNFIKEEAPKKFADPDKALRLLVALNSVQAQSVVDPNGKDYGLDTPLLEIAVSEKDRGEVRATFSPKNEKEDVYFVRVSDRPEVFKLSAHYFQDLDLKDEQLLKEAPAPAGKTTSKVP